MTETHLNSLAEIKRLCRTIDTSAEGSFDLSMRLAEEQGGKFLPVFTGSDREDFYIRSNGSYYEVMEGKFIYLYKIR